MARPKQPGPESSALTLSDVRAVVAGRETVRQVAERRGVSTQHVYAFVRRWRDRLPPPEGELDE